MNKMLQSFSPILDDKKVRSLEVEAFIQCLQSNSNGLAELDVQARLKFYSLNYTLQEHWKNPLLKFQSFFWGPIAWMIETVALLSASRLFWVMMEDRLKLMFYRHLEHSFPRHRRFLAELRQPMHFHSKNHNHEL